MSNIERLDCFDKHARLHESIQEVRFCGYSGDAQDDEVWEKLGKAIGNLKALKTLSISTFDHEDDGDEDEDDDNDEDNEEDDNNLVDIPTSNWKILARILSQVRQKIELDVSSVRTWDAEESRLFARAIHGHPTITSFEDSRGTYPFKSVDALDALYSALATLPAH